MMALFHFSCFSFGVLVLFLLSHCHDLQGHQNATEPSLMLLVAPLFFPAASHVCYVQYLWSGYFVVGILYVVLNTGYRINWRSSAVFIPLLNLCCAGGEEGYFTGMMLKKSRVKFLESEIVTYPTTQMMRNLLVAQVCAHIHHNLVDTKLDYSASVPATAIYGGIMFWGCLSIPTLYVSRCHKCNISGMSGENYIQLQMSTWTSKTDWNLMVKT